MSAAVLVLAVLVPEILLRAAGFEYRAGVRFGYPDAETMAHFQPDELLFWRLKPGGRRDVAGNSRGFPGPDPAIPKPARTFRMLFLGDSCTFQGYPWIAEEELRDLGVPTGMQAESVSMAVPGYTSFQGRRAAEAYGLELEPDVVFVYFGWNDHWAAYGEIDSAKRAPSPVREAGLAGWAFERSRLLQAASRMRDLALRPQVPLEEPRVPPAEFRENLAAIRALFASRGIPVVFLTAPTTFYRQGVPEKLVDDRFAKSPEEAIRLHREYATIVREVAGQDGALLLDLEAECDAAPELSRWFQKDGIHFSPAGRQWLGERIAAFVKERFS